MSIEVARSTDLTWRRDRRAVFADLAALLLTVAIVAVFAVSPLTLEYFGFTYMTSGGNILTKIHPATPIALAALACRCLAAPHAASAALRSVTDDFGVVLLLLATLIAGCDAAAIVHTPVTGLVDSFVLPVVFFILLRDIAPAFARFLAICVVAILLLNAVLAIGEFTLRIHPLRLAMPAGATSDPTLANAVFDWRAQMAQDWRSTALLGHPLVNGLVTCCFMLCLLAPAMRWLPLWFRAALLGTEAVAMFSFGARTSLVVTVAFGALLLMLQIPEARRSRTWRSSRAKGAILLGIAVLLLAIALLAQTELFDRSLDRFLSDNGSAAARVTMFQLLSQFSWSDLLLAPDKDVLATWQRVYGLEFGIESTWIGLALTYGLIVTAILAAGLLAFTWSVLKRCETAAGFVLLAVFLSVSSTASLSGKTTILALIVVLVLLLLPRTSSATMRPDRAA